MSSQTFPQDGILSPVRRLAPANLIEWSTSSSGTQWERFRDSGAVDSTVYFAASPFQRWRLHLTVALALSAIMAVWARALTVPASPKSLSTGEEATVTDDGEIVTLP